MNHAFQAVPYNPHVHWHIYPRYETAPVLDGITFADPLFGHFYDHRAEKLVGTETVEHIASMLRQHVA